MGNCNTQTEEPMTDSCDFIIFIQNIITVDFVVAKNAFLETLLKSVRIRALISINISVTVVPGFGVATLASAQNPCNSHINTHKSHFQWYNDHLRHTDTHSIIAAKLLFYHSYNVVLCVWTIVKRV